MFTNNIHNIETIKRNTQNLTVLRLSASSLSSALGLKINKTSKINHP